VPFSVDITNPADASLVSAFPANERTHRSNFKSMWIVEHDEASAHHVIPSGTIAARDAITDWPANGSLWLRNAANLFPGIQHRRASAWVDVFDYGVGTTAQRDAQTTVPTGALWLNTDTRSVDRYDGAAWQRTLAYFGVGNAAARTALAGASLYNDLFWLETDTNALYLRAGGAWILFGVGSGTQAARPAAAAANLGLLYGNTDDKVVQRSTGAAWVDLWPPLLLQKAESTDAALAYTNAYAYVRNSAGSADLSLDVVTPARGTWQILALAIVKAAGPGGSNKSMLQANLHRGGVAVGQEAGSSHPDYSGSTFDYSAMPIDLFNATAGVTYTYKVQARSRSNNSQSVAAGIFTALIKTA
jgi:hypothetical protein